MKSSIGIAARGRQQRKWLLTLLAVLALIAAACGSTTTEASTEEGSENTDSVEETTTTTEAVAEVAEEQEATDDGSDDDELKEETDDEPEETEVPGEPIELTTLGTSVTVDLGIPTDSFEFQGVGVVGRAGELNPTSSGLLMMRATGFATADSHNAEFPLPLFTGTLDDWLALPNVTVLSQSETTVGGYDATVTDIVLERSDDSIQDCGPAPQDQCILIASTPDPADASLIVVRTGSTIRIWDVDQGEHAPLIFTGVALDGDDEFMTIAQAAVDSIELGEPQPAPEGIVSLLDAGTHSFDSLGGMTLTLPGESIVLEGTQCVLLQFPVEQFESGMIFGRIDQDIDANPIEDDQAYFDNFDGQVSHEETGRTLDLFGTTLTEYAVEETGENMTVSSCAPIGGDVFDDVLAGFIGAGTEYVADADDGGVYLLGWTTINPDESERMLAMFDQIVDSLKVAGS